jgi:TM2 domain-containing membrane protein YozV
MTNRKVLNAIFCIEPFGFGIDKLYYNDIFSGKYDDVFLLHTGLYSGQVLSQLTDEDKKDINDFIDDNNSLLY